MDTSLHHSAVNFGDIPRVQLVVRQLLTSSDLHNSKRINIVLDITKHDYRYEFDDILSPWLNFGCKAGIINNFDVVDNTIIFDLSETHIDNLYALSNNRFNIITI
jgi:hypothetical protein